MKKALMVTGALLMPLVTGCVAPGSYWTGATEQWLAAAGHKNIVSRPLNTDDGVFLCGRGSSTDANRAVIFRSDTSIGVVCWAGSAGAQGGPTAVAVAHLSYGSTPRKG